MKQSLTQQQEDMRRRYLRLEERIKQETKAIRSAQILVSLNIILSEYDHAKSVSIRGNWIAPLEYLKVCTERLKCEVEADLMIDVGPRRLSRMSAEAERPRSEAKLMQSRILRRTR